MRTSDKHTWKGNKIKLREKDCSEHSVLKRTISTEEWLQSSEKRSFNNNQHPKESLPSIQCQTKMALSEVQRTNVLDLALKTRVDPSIAAQRNQLRIKVQVMLTHETILNQTWVQSNRDRQANLTSLSLLEKQLSRKLSTSTMWKKVKPISKE